MRILVAGTDDDTRRQVAVTLQKGGYAVRMAQDNSGTLAALSQEVPQVVLLTTDTPNKSTIAEIRQIRAHARSSATHLVLVTSEVPEAISIDAYRAGLDGEIRLPHAPDYLLARLGAIQRRLEPAARTRATAAQASGLRRAKLAGPEAHAPINVVANSAAWARAPSVLADAASTFLSCEASLEEAAEPSRAPSLGYAILLSNVEQQLELRVAVGADDASGKRLATHLFGPDSDGLVGDMLGEAANIFMGALKTTLGAESLAFTGGLPEAIAPALVVKPSVTYRLQEEFGLAFAGARLIVHLGLRSKANRSVTPAGLAEGMVLAKDVHNPKGLLMVSAGTRLSATMVEKLRGMLPPKQSIEVMDS